MSDDLGQFIPSFGLSVMLVKSVTEMHKLKSVSESIKGITKETEGLGNREGALLEAVLELERKMEQLRKDLTIESTIQKEGMQETELVRKLREQLGELQQYVADSLLRAFWSNNDVYRQSEGTLNETAQLKYSSQDAVLDRQRVLRDR